MFRNNTNNSVLTGINAMPMKDNVADGTADFAQNRAIYAATSSNNNLEKKWIGKSGSASGIIANKRAFAIGGGSTNRVSGQPISLVSHIDTVRREALRRVRNQGSIVPKKVSQRGIDYSIEGSPIIDYVVGGDTQLFIYFHLSQLVESHKIINYRYSINGGKTWSVFLGATQSASPLTIGGLINGVEYNVRIQPYNGYTTGQISNIASGMPIGHLNLPSTISGLSSWVDSQTRSSIVLQNDKVVSWNDKTSGGNNYTTSDNITSHENDTINGRPAINFTTQSMSMLSPPKSRTNSTISVFMIVNHTVSPGTTMNSELFMASDDFKRLDIFSNTRNVGEYLSLNAGYAMQLSSGKKIVGNGPCIISTIVGTTQSSMFLNGDITNISSTANGTGTLYGLPGTYGWRLSGAGFKGYMGEVLVYDTEISAENRQKIEGYLAWKWGLVDKLPSSHPYKNVAP